MKLSKPIKFENIRDDGKGNRIFAIVCCGFSGLAIGIDIFNSKPIIPSLFFLAFSIGLFFIKQKKQFEKVEIDDIGIKVTYGKIEGKLNENQFMWTELKHINILKKQGISDWIEFRDENQSAFVRFGSFGKEFLALLYAISIKCNIKTNGFEKWEVVIQEKELAIPELREMKEIISKIV
jgi:hypothetical protein